jgi:hypothetical protein
MFGDPDERKKVLDDLAWNWKGIVEKVLKEKFGRTLFFQRPKDDDLYRLLSLRTWTLRYKLPLSEILEIILKFWDSIVSKRRMKALQKQQFRGLGCTIPCLCGDRSQEIVAEYVKKKYPNGENVRAWKAERRAMHMRTGRINLVFRRGDSLNSVVDRYREKVIMNRNRNQKIYTRMRRTKRRYPDNPWL